MGPVRRLYVAVYEMPDCPSSWTVIRPFTDAREAAHWFLTQTTYNPTHVHTEIFDRKEDGHG